MSYQTTRDWKAAWNQLTLKNVIFNLLGAFIVAFGTYQVHDVAKITEGGTLGLTLLLQYWLGISPAITSIILTTICFFVGWKVLGTTFIYYSAFSLGGFSAFYWVLEFTPRFFPSLIDMPLLSTILGAIFIGVGVGLSARGGGAQSGDDALALSFYHKYNVPLERTYLVSDLVVLILSFSYLPWQKVLYSVGTVMLSSQIIAFVSGTRKFPTLDKK